LHTYLFLKLHENQYFFLWEDKEAKEMSNQIGPWLFF
jgi:hypothetical protein